MIKKLIFLASVIVFAINSHAQDYQNEYLEEKLLLNRLKSQGYEKRVEIDEANKLVFFKTYFQDHMVGIDSVLMLNQYLEGKNQSYVNELFRENAVKAFEANAQEYGLIGDIDLPITFGKMSSLFGEGGKLVVDGSERVEYSGSKTFDLSGVDTNVTASSLIPEFLLYQHLIVNVTGSVGDRIKVNLNHDSESERESDNKVKVSYQGIDDDILQRIEAGDVDLSLPGIKLIGGTPQHKGLFGIKGSGQVGGVNFTAIASKQTGESEQKQFVGNTKLDSMKLYDSEYNKNRFYFLGLLSSDSIIQLNVFKDDGIGTNNDEQGAVAGRIVYLPGTYDSSMFEGMFILLKSGDNNDYYYNRGGHFIEFLSTVSSNEVIGISYIVKREGGQIDTVGSVIYEEGDTLTLKAIKQKDDYPSSLTWNYMMKNIYTFSSRNIIPESFNLRIKKVNYGSGEDYELENEKTYIKILGLDNNDDGKVDLNYVNFDRGYVFFPQLLPFASESLEEPDSIIYTSQETGTYIGRLYYIDISYRGSQSIYSLGVFNILEGSEVVKINGKTMEKDKDYTIDYEYGIVNFLSDEANFTNAEITIDYQYAPFLSLASKNLLGLHLDYSFSDKITSNSNWLYNTLSYELEDYPRLGEEPQEALVGEFDITYDDRYFSVTDFANLLPFYYSSSPSALSISTKAAISYPNPNSTGKAFIDNMESVLASNDLSTDRKSWTLGSLPPLMSPTDLADDYYWFNEREILGNINELLPELDRDDDVSILSISMNPNGAYPENTFVSFNHSISRTGIDMSDMMFFEVWVKGDSGLLTVEIGKNIIEDVVRKDDDGNVLSPDNILQTEDANNDGILDADEDTGLDNVDGDDSQSISGDDGNDDYNYSTANPNDYSRINGTEGNNTLDTEDLDRDGSLNTNLDVYRFTVALSSSANMVYENASTGWKLYRIPLSSDDVEIVGNPDLKYIKYARMYWTGAPSGGRLSLYQISIVSNKWKNYSSINTTEEKFYVGAKNNQTDPDYDPPYDPGLDYSGKAKREQSMVLYAENLLHSEGGRVYKILSLKDSYERYEKLSMYFKSTDSDSLDLYFKFGGDSMNYYYLKLRPTKEWTHVEIPLETLVNIKISHPESLSFEQGIFGYHGAPSLTNINYIEFVVMNNSNFPATSEVWVDDIMLLEPKRNLGTAGDMSLTFSLPELLTLSLSGNYRNPFFVTINETNGSGNTNSGYRVNASLNGEKLLPEFLGISIPLSYSKSPSTFKPYFRIGTDYRMSEQETAENSSYSNSESYSASLRRSKRFLNPFLHYTLDLLSFSYGYSNGNSRSYSRTDTTNAHSVNASYSLAPPVKSVKILGRMDFYPMPSQFSYSAGFNRNSSASYISGDTGFVKIGSSDNKTVSRSLSTTYKVFRSLNLSFSEQRTNDLNYEGDGRLSAFGLETGKNHTISLQYNPVFVRFISHNLNLNTSYTERNNQNLIVTDDPYNITDFTNNGRFSVGGFLDYPFLLSWLMRLRNEANDSTAIVMSPPWMAKYLETFFEKFTPLNYSYSKTNANSYSYVSSRAPLLFQLGLTDSIPYEMYSERTDLRKNTSESYSFSSSVNLGNVSMSGSFSRSISTTGLSDNINRDINTRWPSLSFEISGLEDIILLNKGFRSLSLRNSFNRSSTEAGKLDSLPDRKTESIDFLPLIGFNGVFLFGMNANYNFNYTTNLQSNLGTIETMRKSENFSHSLSISYSFSSPTGMNIPLLNKRIKFKSNLNTGIDFSFSKSIETDITNENALEERILYDIKPRADYNFSNNVTGGLNMGFTRSEDIKRGDKRQSFSAGFYVLFRF
ncbi:MAG: hypothetical protein PHW02_01030 [bacterium]|nr:hypothetical protein [bacterium]